MSLKTNALTVACPETPTHPQAMQRNVHACNHFNAMPTAALTATHALSLERATVEQKLLLRWTSDPCCKIAQSGTESGGQRDDYSSML